MCLCVCVCMCVCVFTVKKQLLNFQSLTSHLSRTAYTSLHVGEDDPLGLQNLGDIRA